MSRPIGRWLGRMALVATASSQLGATCAYSPPPVISVGQGADTLGVGRGTVAAEAGLGRAASWWNASNAADYDVTSGPFGAGRIRIGVGENLDLGLVGGAGPDRTFVLGPEAKWRFSRREMPEAEGAPGFHVALISGVGVGSAEYRYATTGCSGTSPCLRTLMEGEARPRHLFAAPYAGVVTSGGIETVRMFVGLRVAASETLGNQITDLTFYPVLAFGVQVQPTRRFGLYAEGDIGGAITTQDFHDSALIGYATAGLSVTFDDLWRHGPPAPEAPP